MTRAAGCTLNDATERLRQLLGVCAVGDLPPALTLAHVLVETKSVTEALQLLSCMGVDQGLDAPTQSKAVELERLLLQNRGAADRVIDMLDGVDHQIRAATPDDGIAAFRAMFDRAVVRCPEGSVALHSLGRSDLLEASTAEIAEQLRIWDLLGPSKRVLDIGCGIGRFEQALAAEVAAIVGIDISANMIAEAERRCANLPNVRLLQTAGSDLRLFGPGSFDLVLSVDAFPYLVQAGLPLVEQHFREIARVLAPGGDLVILNFSYRGDLAADQRDVAQLADAHGFRIIRNGTSDFRLWDGVNFLLETC